MNLEQIIENHICRFNDYPQRCECYIAGIKEILEGVKQELEKLREDYNEEHICRFNDKPQKCDCYGECLTNIINKLKVIIKK